ncbi:MAG TPA: cytochrome c biogenesis protein CcsA [Coriobacteriia bacterium]
MTQLGSLLLGLSLLGAVVSIGALVFGHYAGPKDGRKITSFGYVGTLVVFLTTTLATLLLLVALMTKDFSFLYVIQNHSRDVSNLSWLYSISALWAGREGSLLFWAWLLSTFSAYMAWRRMSKADPVSNLGIAVLDFVQLFFLVALFFETNNPFVAAPAGAVDAAGNLLGQFALAGMNPLLQHWAMILHPPTLFIGYAGMTVPFAFALGALFAGDGSKLWVEIVDRVTVFAWLMLGIGIGLGAIWAYVVLGWGGYWAWDPVENASLLPWLTGVGLLHTFTVYRRRGSFKNWAVMMSAVSFVLVLLGTFITRSGVISSVHGFEPDIVSLWWFLGMMILSLAVPALMLWKRRQAFRSDNEFTSLMSKEGSHYFTNLFMLFSALLVAALTLSPAKIPIPFTSIVLQAGPTFSASAFDLLSRPVGIIFVLIMTVCPILSWGATGAAAFWKRAKWPLAGAGVLGAIFIAIWYTAMLPNYIISHNLDGTVATKGLPAMAGIQAAVDHTESIIGLLVAAWAIALPIYLFIEGSRARSRAKGENPFASFFHILFKSRSQSGGYLTHLGIGIVLVGLIGSSMYVQTVRMSVPDKPGTPLSWVADSTQPDWRPNLGGLSLVYQGFDSVTLANQDVQETVKLDLKQGDTTIGSMSPSIVELANRSENQSTRYLAALDVGLLRDVFVAFQGVDQSSGTALLQFEIKINPMISWAWVGFVIMIIGTAIAMVPKRERALAAVPAPKPAAKKKR